MDPERPENPVFIFLESHLKQGLCVLAVHLWENKMDVRDE